MKTIKLEGTVKYPIKQNIEILKKGTKIKWVASIKNATTGMEIRLTTKNQADLVPGENVVITICNPQTTLNGDSEEEKELTYVPKHGSNRVKRFQKKKEVKE